MRTPREAASAQARSSSSRVSCAPSSRALKRSAPRYTASAPLATAALTASSEPAGARSSGARWRERIARKIRVETLFRRAFLDEPQEERDDDEGDTHPPNHGVFTTNA